MKWAKGLSVLAVLAVPAALLTRPVAAYAQAQSAAGRVTGVVTDSASGAPIPNVSVVVVGTQNGAQTDASGRFTIRNVPNGTIQLRAQRIGYSPSTRSVVVTNGAAPNVSFALNVQAVQLAEIVSVGYGTQSRRNVTGAVATVTTDALEKAPVASIDQVLQGTAPGVQVTTASSEPGGALSIRIRGTSSITGNSEPLYVIDGFPIENDIAGSSAGNGGRSQTTPPNPLVTLNPSDIESISILKDASATAIYGARGANGVVIITTKQGKGTRPQFTIDSYTGVSNVAKRYDLLDAAGYMAYANAYGAASSTPFTPFPDSVKAKILASGIDTDWQDEVFQQGQINNLQLTTRGATNGASPTRYALSGGYFKQSGVVVGSGIRRLSARVNLTQSFGSHFEVGGNFTAAQARTKATPTAGQQNGNAGAVSAALQYVPILPVRRADGTYSYINTDLNAYSALLDAPQTPNPVSLARDVTDSLSDTRLLGNFYGQATFLNDFTAKISLGTDYASRWRNTYYPRTTLRGSQTNGTAIRGTNGTNSWLNENTLTYQHKFGIHDLTVLGGYSVQQTNADGTSMTNTNFVSDITGYFDIGAGTQTGGPSIGSTNSSQTLQSWLSRVNYNLLDRYLFTVTYRADGSSRFASNKKWGAFPSAAFAWRASDESFFKHVSQLDDLKFRVSYGIVGNPSIRPYQSLARLNSQTYSFGGVPIAGYYTAAVGNPNLTWESTRQLDGGLDLALFHRLNITADYYTKRTTNLLLQVSLPYETGFESALANVGAIENKGVELGIDGDIWKGAKKQSFNWHSAFNWATNKNKVLDLGGQKQIFADVLTTDYNLPGTLIQVGQPLGVFYGFKSHGVIRDSAQAATITYRNFNNAKFQPGSMLIENIDSDTTITLADRTIVGDPTPKFTYGWTNTLTWKGLELTGLLQGQVGGKILNVNRIRTESSPRANIAPDRFYQAWSPTNMDAKYPKIGENPDQVGTNNFTDNLLESGTYARLRTLTLSYGLPSRLYRRIGGTSARLYVTGTNLFTISDYSGFDPDVSSLSVNNLNRGVDIGAYPLSRVITTGVTIGF